MAVQLLRTVFRRALRVQGIVQGVGFRPFVHRLAVRHRLAGFVRNETGGVSIEVEGEAAALEAFAAELTRTAPPHARIGKIFSEAQPPRGEPRFTIEPSRLGPSPEISISPDLATCADCLREILDPADRRHRYAFTNCTACGPRFTVVESAPYDRERTSMAAFRLCPPCSVEYADPGDRRYHAEATACPDCGPRLRLTPEEAGLQLGEGKILAVKGLGGFHLACDAGNEEAVRELRRRKGRDEKPFAVMVPDLAAARLLCEVSPDEEALLRSAQGPIVLLRRRADAAIAEAVAPGNPLLGLLLPYTPLHHLLLAEAGTPLVLTSGNASDEPIACDDQDALRSLGGIADLFLTHDRAIRTRCDDSVARIVGGELLILRRSRGYAPAPVALPFRVASATLALGGAQKAVFALGRGEEAVLSQHLGDLDRYEGWRAYVSTVERFERLFGFAPAVVAHDLHPDYPTTRYALERTGVRRIAVQHHHAHMASCMAENGLTGPLIGVTFDGTGYGSDGAIWGGEFLVGDYRGFRRAAHFEYVPMPGGEAAIREPWRMAVAYLAHAGEQIETLRGRIPDRNLEIVSRLKGPPTSSCGRLFDGVSSLLGVRDRVSYEGQAAIELEWLAQESDAEGTYPVEFLGEGSVSLAPLIAGLLADLRRGASRADVARRFHSTIVEVVRKTCSRLCAETGLDRVVLSGGVFMNEILLTGSVDRLGRDGFRVFRHRLVPPNDGGLCLGQLAVAAAVGG